MAAVDDGFIDVFFEILSRADEIAFVADILAPGIFDFPAVGFAVAIEVDAREQHGVRRRTAAVLQAFPFRHVRRKTAQQGFVLNAVRIPDSVFSSAEGTGIAGKPHGLSGFKLLNAQIFQLFLGQVEGFHIGAGHIFNAVEANEAMEGLIRRRFMDDRHIITKGYADVLSVKFLRRQIPFFVIDLILVAVGKVKGLDGLAKGDAFGL